MRSLRGRVIRGIVFWATVAVLLSFILLISFFRAYSKREFDNRLASHELQVLIALADTRGDPDLLNAYLTNPEFRNAYSGLYWQIIAQNGDVLTSPSAAFGRIEVPDDVGPESLSFDGDGPDGEVRGLHKMVSLDDGSEWIVSVAQSLAILRAVQAEAEAGFLTALLITASVALTGVGIQMIFILRPLTQMREEVAGRWHAGEALKPEAYPSEVSPLIADINVLLSRNRGIVESARRQTADLAHALKTPTAVIRNVLERPRRGAKEIAEAREALDRVDAQIMRSLARIRAGNAAAMAYRTEVLVSCERLARLFRAMRTDRPLKLEILVPAGLTVMVDQQDLEEVLGNLLENAFKWRREVIRVSAAVEEEIVAIFVDDDGPGVPEEQRINVLEPGRRLDVSAPGTGLGLAIATDLVSAYDGGLELDTAPELGGLRVAVLLPQKGSLLVGGESTPVRNEE